MKCLGKAYINKIKGVCCLLSQPTQKGVRFCVAQPQQGVFIWCNAAPTRGLCLLKCSPNRGRLFAAIQPQKGCVCLLILCAKRVCLFANFLHKKGWNCCWFSALRVRLGLLIWFTNIAYLGCLVLLVSALERGVLGFICFGQNKTAKGCLICLFMFLY